MSRKCVIKLLSDDDFKNTKYDDLLLLLKDRKWNWFDILYCGESC